MMFQGVKIRSMKLLPNDMTNTLREFSFVHKNKMFVLTRMSYDYHLTLKH